MSYLEIQRSNRLKTSTAAPAPIHGKSSSWVKKGRGNLSIMTAPASNQNHGGKLAKQRKLDEIVKKGGKEEPLRRMNPRSRQKLAAVKNDNPPRTITTAPLPPKNVHFSNVIDRFRPGEPASQILLANRVTTETTRTTRTTEFFQLIEGHHDTDPASSWRSAILKEEELYERSDKIERRIQDGHQQQQQQQQNHHQEGEDECDLEFINASFVYSDEEDDDDDALSVNEFSLDDSKVVVKRDKSLELLSTTTPQANAEPDQQSTLTGLMKSFLPIKQSLFGTNNNDEPSIFSTVTTAGERIFRGVAEAIFCDRLDEHKSVFSYNDYTITMCGNDLSLNSVFLGGGENQRVRIFVEAKEEEASTVTSNLKSTLNVSVTTTSWTLTSRDRKGYTVGSIEINAPTAVPLHRISVQGPFQGLVCINIP